MFLRFYRREAKVPGALCFIPSFLALSHQSIQHVLRSLQTNQSGASRSRSVPEESGPEDDSGDLPVSARPKDSHGMRTESDAAQLLGEFIWVVFVLGLCSIKAPFNSYHQHDLSFKSSTCLRLVLKNASHQHGSDLHNLGVEKRGMHLIYGLARSHGHWTHLSIKSNCIKKQEYYKTYTKDGRVREIERERAKFIQLQAHSVATIGIWKARRTRHLCSCWTILRAYEVVQKWLGVELWLSGFSTHHPNSRLLSDFNRLSKIFMKTFQMWQYRLVSCQQQ